MPPVTQRIPDLLGGVSQQAPHRRRPNELEESLNALHSPMKGLGKRPNTLHIAKLSATPEDFDNAAVRLLDYGAGKRFLAVLLNEDVQVWDDNGVAQTVNFPHGTAYLATTGVGSLRTATLDRRTFAANREMQAQRDRTRKAPVQTPQAVLYVEQADYSTTYAVTIDGLVVEYETLSGSDPSARRQIATDNIAAEMRAALVNALPGFSVDQFGSMLRVQRSDGGDFTIAATDGLGDNGLVVVKGTVQRSADLPLRCVNNVVLEVAGDPEEARDNYWVRFDTDGSDDFRGVWRECARPGEGIALDPATLPHELVYSTELTPEMEARGLGPLPSVTLVNPVADLDTYGSTLNGADVDLDEYPTLNDQDEDMFVNLEDTNGGPIKVEIRYDVDTTHMAHGEVFFLKVAHNDGVSSTTWTTFKTLAFGPGVFLKDQLLEASTTADIGADWDVRVWVEYASGVTPAPGTVGTVVLYSRDAGGFRYYNYSARDVTWRSDALYPKGTEWTVTVEGTPVVYTLASDMSGAAVAIQMATPVNLLAGVSAVATANERGEAIRIGKDAGGVPTVSVSVTFPTGTQFWNPEIDLGYTADDLDGKILRNLSDGSEGTITDCYAHGVTVASLSGGVENLIRPGDLCIVVDTEERFTFRQVAWKDRAAGDSVTNPWPSFRDDYIRDVFFHRGRLGFLAGSNIVMSEAGVPENFYRTATTDLLDSDPIDVKWSGGNNARFHTAVAWNGETVLFGDRVQVVPRGEPVLSPKTIRLDLLSSYPCDPSASPVAAGPLVFYGRPVQGSTHMQALRISPRSRVAEAVTLTEHVPTYLAGTPLFFAVDAALNTLFVSTDADRRTLYHLTYKLEDDTAPLYSWGQWEFVGEVLGLDVLDGTVLFVLKYSDGIYLETLDLTGGL